MGKTIYKKRTASSNSQAFQYDINEFLNDQSTTDKEYTNKLNKNMFDAIKQAELINLFKNKSKR